MQDETEVVGMFPVDAREGQLGKFFDLPIYRHLCFLRRHTTIQGYLGPSPVLWFHPKQVKKFPRLL